MFAIHAVNSETGKVFRHTSRITKNTVTFYAEKGLIKTHDETDGTYKVCSRREFLLRAKAISDGILRSEPSDERSDQVRLVQTMVLAAQAAGDQGDPFSRRAIEEMLAATRRQRLVRPGVDLHALPQAPPGKPHVPLSVLGETRHPGVVAKSSPIVVAR